MSRELRVYYREKLLSAILRKDKKAERMWNDMLITLTKIESRSK